MKPFLFCSAALLALTAAGQTAARPAGTAPSAKCLDASGKPCTASQVRDLGTGIATGRRVHQALATVKSVELGSSDGTIKCVQNDGSPCTAAQFEAINQIAAQQKCSINYNSSKSNTRDQSRLKQGSMDK